MSLQVGDALLKSLQGQVMRPRQVDSADQVNWEAETDVAIVGYGAAGASAALEAAGNRVRVTVLDRLNGGGASALSGGVVYAGGGTVYQQQAGDVDTVDNMFRYLKQETCGVVSDSTLQRFCAESIGNLNWLQQHGVPFDGTAYDDKSSYPPEGYFLYYSGNESCSPFRDHAKPARRGHRTKGKNMTGRIMFSALHNALQKYSNVNIQTHCEVQRLIVDRENQVIGLEYLQAPTAAGTRSLMTAINRLANRFAFIQPGIGEKLRSHVHRLRRKGTVHNLRVHRGVILSTGGFIFNNELVKKFAPRFAQNHPLGEDCIGAGIALGVSVGGDIAQMNRVSAWRFFSPPNDMLKGVLVNEHGKRICNEDLYGATTAERILDSGAQKAYVILDNVLLKAVSRKARPGSVPWQQWIPARLFLGSSKKADTLEKLAKLCGIDPANLQETIQTYNHGVTTGADAFAKADKYCQPLQSGPYSAVDVSFNNKAIPTPSITLGGLRVDEFTGRVLDAQDKPIAGLYAAGRAAVGICSHSYISGLSLADCVFSGRRAGEQVARELTT